MSAAPSDIVEVVFETESTRDVTQELEADERRKTGFPPTVVRAGKLFRLVRREIVSASGQRTRLRVVYRQT